MEQQIFINEIQTSFVLRQPKSTKPTNIYLVCRIQGKQVKLATGVKVYPEHWNTIMKSPIKKLKHLETVYRLIKSIFVIIPTRSRTA